MVGAFDFAREFLPLHHNPAHAANFDPRLGRSFFHPVIAVKLERIDQLSPSRGHAHSLPLHRQRGAESAQSDTTCPNDNDSHISYWWLVVGAWWLVSYYQPPGASHYLNNASIFAINSSNTKFRLLRKSSAPDCRASILSSTP